MFKKIKEFFVGKPKEVAAEAPYKTEAANETILTVVPAGTEASVAAPTYVAPVTVEAPVAKAKPAKAPKVAKPKAEKPAVAKAPAVKKPRVPKTK